MPSVAPQIKLVDKEQVNFLKSDLQSVSFRWLRDNVAIPMTSQIVGQFTPAKTYFLPSLTVNQLFLGGKISDQAFLTISTTPAIPALSATGTIGTNLRDYYGRRISDFLNWLPYGWLLPPDRTIYLMAGSTAVSKASSGFAQVAGSATLYLMETYDQ